MLVLNSNMRAAMSILPLFISTDATNWIMKQLQMGRTSPETADLDPVLFFGFGYELKDKEGRLSEAYTDHFFDIGWYRPETIADNGGIEIDLLGFRYFVFPDTLERLRDKQLILEIVETGYPTPINEKRQLLRAVSR